MGDIVEWAEAARDWIVAEVLAIGTFGQAGVGLIAFAIAYFAARPFRRWAESGLELYPLGMPFQRLASATVQLSFPIFAVALLGFSAGVAAELGWDQGLIEIVLSLLGAWIIITLISSLTRRTPWTRLLVVIIWSIAALNILGLFGPAVDFLDRIAVTLGGLRISALTVLSALIVFGVLLWLALFLSGLLDRRIKASPDLSPAVQVLISKLVKIGLIVFAVVIALNSVGINLTGLTVFGGAVGLGIGFGLQKIVSNLISGVILILDKSLKPGDVIEVGNTYGSINALNARYVSVITRDGTEHLIPNEEFVITPVINWSHSHNKVRIKQPIGISYKSDVHKVIELILQAAGEHERVLSDPKPVCFIVGFGDSAVDLELRIWVDDPQNGVSNVRGAILLRVWDLFREHGVEIPYPQRDLHVRSSVPLDIRARGGAQAIGGTRSDRADETDGTE